MNEWQRPYFTFSAPWRCNRRNRRSISHFCPCGLENFGPSPSPNHDFLPFLPPPVDAVAPPGAAFRLPAPFGAAAAGAGGGGAAGPAGCLRLRTAGAAGGGVAAGGDAARARTARDDAPRGASSHDARRPAVPLAPATLLACAGPCWSCRPRAAAPSKLHATERAL